MAEVFFGVAWAAGVVEGGAVLAHANTNDAGHQRSPLTQLIPSILYGTVALPLGTIGASPGPLLVSKFPFAPSLLALESSDGEASIVARHQSTRGDVAGESKPLSTELNKKQSPPETSSSDDNDSKEQDGPTILSRHDMIHKLREENRRALAASRQQHRQPIIEKAVRVQRRRKPTTIWSSRLWLSTLDGRPLATPLAEAMRRVRFLSVGAGLVMAAMAYQESRRRDETEREQVYRGNRGRDKNAIQSLVKSGDCHNGVALRLVDRNDSLPLNNHTSKGVVVPLVHSRVENDNNSSVSSAKSNGATYWNLGTTPQDWKELPLTQDWLLHNDRNEAYLVLEANVSSNHLSHYLIDESDNTIELLENAMLVSRILDMIATQKQAALSNVNKNVTTMNVLVGSGPRPRELDDPNTIYVNGTIDVSRKVVSTLEQLYPKEVESETTDGDSESIGEPIESDDTTEDRVSWFEYVGMKVRKGGALVASVVSRMFTWRNATTKTVHVLSDSPVAAKWLQRIMPYGWLILGYSALDDVQVCQKAIAEDGSGGVVFVCCENDEATCATVCSLLTNDDESAATRIVVLVHGQEHATSLSNLATEVQDGSILEILSVCEIHNDMFARARELLASGKSPSEVQDSLEYQS